MKYEFLVDYEEKEKSAHLDWYSKIKEGQLDTPYSSLSRFKNIKEPIGEVSYNNVWSVIPSFNTVLVPIYPIKVPSFFEKNHGFRIEDIPTLVQFSRDEGRVQFF